MKEKCYVNATQLAFQIRNRHFRFLMARCNDTPYEQASEAAAAAAVWSPDKADAPVVSCPGCSTQLAGSRNQGSGSGWRSGPILWLHQTAHQTTGTFWEAHVIRRGHINRTRWATNRWTRSTKNKVSQLYIYKNKKSSELISASCINLRSLCVVSVCCMQCVSHCLDIHAACSKASSALPIFFLHRSMCFLNWAMASRGVLCWKHRRQI